MIFFSGLIRVAIAFALSLEIDESIAPHRNEMVSTTLMMVLMTTIVLGGVMSAFAKLIGLEKENLTPSHEGGDHDSFIDQLKERKLLKPKKRSWLQKKLNWLDDSVLKPLFGGDLSRIAAHKEENQILEEMEKQQKIEKDKNKSNILSAINTSDGPNVGLEESKSRKGKETENNLKVAHQTKLASIAEDEEDN